MSNIDPAIQPYLRDGGIDPDAVVGAGSKVELGPYVGKLSAIEVQAPRSEKDAGALAVSFVILEDPKHDGQYVGMDARDWWTLMVLPPKAAGGKIFAPGLAEMKAAAAAVGSPITEPLQVYKPELLKKQIAKALGKKVLDIVVIEDSYESGGEKKTKHVVKVIGLHKPGPRAVQPAAAATPATAAVEPEAAATEEDDDLL